MTQNTAKARATLDPSSNENASLLHVADSTALSAGATQCADENLYVAKRFADDPEVMSVAHFMREREKTLGYMKMFFVSQHAAKEIIPRRGAFSQKIWNFRKRVRGIASELGVTLPLGSGIMLAVPHFVAQISRTHSENPIPWHQDSSSFSRERHSPLVCLRSPVRGSQGDCSKMHRIDRRISSLKQHSSPLG